MGWFNHQLGEMSCRLVGFLLCEMAQFLHIWEGPGIYIYIYMDIPWACLSVLVFGVLKVFSQVFGA